MIARPTPDDDYDPNRDAQLLPDIAVGGLPDHEILFRIVEIRVSGRWRPGVLTAWRRLPLG